ncbi:hypothetical protein ACFVSU_10640 [Microbacterium sp. NPDC058062]|uniref:hypothetical protein n=1 Tax=Microbacterium sp. NPDC058062 TaxID=3346320 RepID=UPI0036DC4132
MDEFLAEMERLTGTQPEVVNAYLSADASADDTKARNAAARVIVTGYPEFHASAPNPSSDFRPSATAEAPPEAGVAAASAAGRWDPEVAEVQILDLGSTINIIEKYSWPDTFTSNVYNMPNHWGMEFTVDFWTSMRTPPPFYVPPVTYGYRPWCGWGDYKDWAAASNDVFNWFAMVMDGNDYVYAPGQIGFYGDYNDLSDECTRSSVSVGMAQPWAMPYSSWGSNEVMLSLFPDRGQDTWSKIDANIQAVERHTCETNTSMPLTDCMGATPSVVWPGPGANSRGVLSLSRNWTAPDKCWVSLDWGTTDPLPWACSAGS